MSEGIGAFTIGESPIGAQPWDYSPTVLSQYANSPTITALLADFSAWIDVRADIDNFYDYVFNLASAQGFGLDIWGRILNIGRFYQVADPYHFGFAEAQSSPIQDVGAFGQGVFWSGAPLTGNYALSDDAYRQLLFAKAFANVCDGSIPALNQLLRQLFPGRGNAYVQNNGGLIMTYVFNFATSPVEKTVVQTSGVLPQPTGMVVNYSFV